MWKETGKDFIMDEDAGARDDNPRGKREMGWVGLCPDGERWERGEEGVIQVMLNC